MDDEYPKKRSRGLSRQDNSTRHRPARLADTQNSYLNDTLPTSRILVLDVGGDDRVQIWRAFQCRISILRTPAVRHVKYGVREKGAPTREDLAHLPCVRQSILAAPAVSPLAVSKRLKNGNHGRSRHSPSLGRCDVAVDHVEVASVQFRAAWVRIDTK